MMFPNRIRIFNKYVTNRILRGFASFSHGPFAIIRHVGRRSGKPYETVIMVWPMGEGFVIALTYGPKVDWYRNILAAGGCTVFWHRRVYAVGKPEPIDVKTALPAFSPLHQFILRLIGIQDFVRVKFAVPEPATLGEAARPHFKA
jgi:deazaflavin-dependent oxidoreductase (nitroreductase family)